MVYIHSWQEFQVAAEALYVKSPDKARYSVKWKASEGKLTLKITDDVECLKFKTYSSMYLGRFEALTLSLMEKMQNRQEPEPEVLPTPLPGSQSQGDAMVVDSPSIPNVASTTAGGGGAKKKKPKKKK